MAVALWGDDRWRRSASSSFIRARFAAEMCESRWQSRSHPLRRARVFLRQIADLTGMQADHRALRILQDRDLSSLADLRYVEADFGAQLFRFLERASEVRDRDVIEPAGRAARLHRLHHATEGAVAESEHGVIFAWHGKLLGLPAEELGVESDRAFGIGRGQFVPADGVGSRFLVF